MEHDSDSEERKEEAMTLRHCLNFFVFSPWTMRAVSRDQTPTKTIVFHCLLPPTCSIYFTTSPSQSILETCHQPPRYSYSLSIARPCQCEFEVIESRNQSLNFSQLWVVRDLPLHSRPRDRTTYRIWVTVYLSKQHSAFS